MNRMFFYDQLTAAGGLGPVERRNRFARLHTAVLADYQAAVRALTPEQAACPVEVGDDRRTVAQVVGHVMEWERFMVLSAGDLLAGSEQPRMLLSLDGYVDEDGSTPAFKRLREFNAYQAEKHAGWTWEKMRALALETSATLHTLFTYPQLVSLERLERTRPMEHQLTNGAQVPELPMGWIIWMIALEHAGVEHTRELGLPE